MRKAMKLRIVFAHLLMAALILVVALVPNHRRNVADPTAFFVAIGIIEVLYLVALVHGRKQDPFPQGSTDITLCVWVLLLLWEIFGPVLGIAHNVLLPSPENVFNVFVDHGGELALSVVSSLELLLSGFFFGTLFGVILGVICGWIPRLCAMFYPIANVFAPIPSVVFTPFLVILMPNYRLAAVMVILLGVFWPQFLSMILRVGSLPPAIIDNLKGLRISLTTGFLMLMYAESFGAKSGIGYWISNANVFANYANIYAGIITCGITVTVLNYGSAWLQKRFTKWH